MVEVIGIALKETGRQWGNLTDDDLDKIAGRRDQLEGKIQERYGITKDAARKDIDDWMMRQCRAYLGSRMAEGLIASVRCGPHCAAIAASGVHEFDGAVNSELNETWLR
jgi:uncharacterized protein YjbJ (UPF0337 family)